MRERTDWAFKVFVLEGAWIIEKSGVNTIAAARVSEENSVCLKEVGALKNKVRDFVRSQNHEQVWNEDILETKKVFKKGLRFQEKRHMTI